MFFLEHNYMVNKSLLEFVMISIKLLFSCKNCFYFLHEWSGI